MIQQILHNKATLSDDHGFRSRGLHRDDGRFAQGVDLLELGGRELGGWVAVEDLKLVRDFELFEEPEDALGAGFL